MNLLFSLEAAQPFGANKWHGGGKYAEVVFFRMIERGVRFSCYYDSRKWINPLILNICKQNNILLFDLKHEKLVTIIKKNRIDVIFAPLLRDELFEITDTHIICPIHDVRGLAMPSDRMQLRYKQNLKGTARSILQLFFQKLWLKKEYKRFAPIILNKNNTLYTVSFYSKYSLLSFFPKLEDNKIKVFYSPDTTKYNSAPTISQGKYFLMVSGNRWIKNNLRAIMALDKLMTENRLRDYNVIITGAKACDFRYKIKNAKRFKFLGYVDEQKLTELYANCYSFIFPSLNEGFGYPPLEAMKYGKPVIASPFSAISEICGDSVLYFNPFDVMDIYNRILMLLNTTIYSTLSARSLNRYQIISNKQVQDLDKLIDYIFKI